MTAVIPPVKLGGTIVLNHQMVGNEVVSNPFNRAVVLLLRSRLSSVWMPTVTKALC